VIPGDGIGKESCRRVARARRGRRRFGFSLALNHFDWSCETYQATGRMMPEDGSIAPRSRRDLPRRGRLSWRADHISLWAC